MASCWWLAKTMASCWWLAKAMAFCWWLAKAMEFCWWLAKEKLSRGRRRHSKPKSKHLTTKESKTMSGKRCTVVTQPPPEFPYDIILEILKRLPAKSLMRFKCVSKEWFNIIVDPFFVESHQNHARTRPDASHVLFFLFHLDCNAVVPTNQALVFSTQLPLHTFSYETQPCSNIVNGLICVSSDLDIPSIWVLKPTTTQKKALPTPELINSRYKSTYFLGFDPVSKKYKILHHGYKYSCVIFTLGSKTWRQVTSMIPQELGREAICLDGRIYFNNVDKVCRAITFFDLNEEKFGLLALPEDLGRWYGQMIEVRGKLALVPGQKIWILEHNNWVEKSINLPNDIDWGFFGVTGNGNILLECYNLDIAKYWFYDLNTSECIATRVNMQSCCLSNVIENLLSNLLSNSSRPLFCNYIENITPL